MFLVKDQLQKDKVRIKDVVARRKADNNNDKTGGKNEQAIRPILKDLASAIEEEKRELEEYVIKEVAGCFDAIDQGKLDALTSRNIKSVFEFFDEEIEDDACQMIIDKFDTTGSGVINMSDFYREMYDTVKDGTSEKHVRMVFDAMDTDRNGVLGLHEIMGQFANLGYILTKEEGMSNLAKIDSTGTGYFNYDMFKRFCFGLDDSNRHPVIVVDELESIGQSIITFK